MNKKRIFTGIAVLIMITLTFVIKLTINDDPYVNISFIAQAPDEVHIHAVAEAIVLPTCTERGHTVFTCDCGHEYFGDYVDAIGHDYKALIHNATCLEGGYTTNTCSTCGDSYTSDPTDPLGHSYQQVDVAATCTTDGYSEFTCQTCNDSYQSNHIEAIGHKWNNWETTCVATIFNSGEKQRTCSACTVIEEQQISRLSTPTRSLNKPSDPEAFMTIPTQEAFGEYYDRAMELYNAILTREESIYLYFGGDAQYEKGRQEYVKFVNMFESEVLHNKLAVISSSYSTGAFSVGKGLVRVTVNPSQTYDLAKKCYEVNKSAGLYNGIPELEAVTKINQWLIDNLRYELGHADPMDVIQTRKAQCAGYAKLFYHLCRNANIQSVYVVGCTEPSSHGSGCYGCHAWNKVKIGGTWYYIDTCWNDANTPNRYFLSKKLWSDRVVCSEREIYW